MKTYISNLLPKLQEYSARLDNLTLLTDQPWVQLDESGDRTVFVFRSDGNELLVSRNGKVNTCTWEYLEHMNSLVIETDEEKTLYNQGFLDESAMILRKDGRDEYLLLANENKVEVTAAEKVLEQLERKYIEDTSGTQQTTLRPHGDAKDEKEPDGSKGPDRQRTSETESELYDTDEQKRDLASIVSVILTLMLLTAFAGTYGEAEVALVLGGLILLLFLALSRVLI